MIHERGRNGFGSALKLGFRAAREDLVFVVTADLPFSLEALLDALPHLDGRDYVISYRSRDDRSVGRRIQSAGYNALIRTLLGIRARHVNSGFKLYRRETIQGIEIQTNSWFVDAEVLFRLAARGARCAEIPVELINRKAGRSSVGTFTFLSILGEALRFALRERAPWR